jgi:hypothetical protein
MMDIAFSPLPLLYQPVSQGMVHYRKTIPLNGGRLTVNSYVWLVLSINFDFISGLVNSPLPHNSMASLLKISFHFPFPFDYSFSSIFI